MKRVCLKIQAALMALEKIILLAALSGMLLAVSTAIVTRPLSIDVPWVTPLVLALMIIATFAGAALATASRRHITMDLLTKALGQRGRGAVALFTSALGAAISGFLSLTGLRWVQGNMAFDDPISLALKLPDWWLQSVLPLGFGLFAVHFLINLALDASALISGDFSHLPLAGEPAP